MSESNLAPPAIIVSEHPEESSAESVQWSENHLRRLLSDGGVPEFPAMTPRHQLLALTRSTLVSMCLGNKSTHVTVLHGVGGSGKTVLAAEAVKHGKLLVYCFPRSVVWMSTGHMRYMVGERLLRGIQKLLIDLLRHPLIGWKPGEHQQLSACSMAGLKAVLTELLSQRRLLLVLDDVWQKEVVKVFDGVPMVLLVTTRNRAIADPLHAQIEYIEVARCDYEEAASIVQSLCGEITEVVLHAVLKRCSGLPIALLMMATSLVGKSLERQLELFSTQNRDNWLLYPLPPLPVGCECLAEVYEAIISDMATSESNVAHLSGKEILQLYLDLAMVDNDEEFFADKVTLLWNRSRDETEQLLQQFAARAMLSKVDKADEERDSCDDKGDRKRTYTLRRVQHDFMRAVIKSQTSRLLDRHRRLVEAFVAKHGNPQPSSKGTTTDTCFKGFKCCRRGGAVHPQNDDGCTISASKLIRVIEHGGEWWECSDALLLLLEQQRTALPPLEQEVLWILLPKRGKRGWTALHEACRRGVSSAVNALLGMELGGVSTSTTQFALIGLDSFDAGSTPLHVACAMGHFVVAQCLLDKGADPRATSVHGQTALHQASAAGSTRLVHCLLEKGADLHAADEVGNRALHHASASGCIELVEYLLIKGAELGAATKDGWRAMHIASLSGNVNMVDLLISQGADVNAAVRDGRTALHLGCGIGCLPVEQYLVEKGANLEAADEAGNTALLYASRSGNLKVVRYLVDKGANVHAVDKKGRTALHLGCQLGGSLVQVARYFLRKGVDLNKADGEGKTALHYASLNGSVEVMQYLIRKGAAQYACDGEGKTALHLASEAGHLAMVQFLVEKTENVHVLDSEGKTPLHSVCSSPSGSVDLVRYLVGKGADMRAIDNAKRTALVCAHKAGHLDIVQYLEEKEADVRAADGNGKTVLYDSESAAPFTGNPALAPVASDNGVIVHHITIPVHDQEDKSYSRSDTYIMN